MYFTNYYFYLHKVMATPPRSPPYSDGQLEAISKRSRQLTRLRSLTLRTLDQPRPMVNVDPGTGRGSGPHKENVHSYLGVVAHEKIAIVRNNWKDVLESLKDLVWNDILVSLHLHFVFNILVIFLNQMFTSTKCNTTLSYAG